MAKRTRKSKPSTMNISMTPKMRAALDNQMRRGGFDDASKYVRHLIRAEEARVAPAWLEELIEEGLKGPFEVADERWWAERRAKLAAAVKRTESRRRRSA